MAGAGICCLASSEAVQTSIVDEKEEIAFGDQGLAVGTTSDFLSTTTVVEDATSSNWLAGAVGFLKGINLLWWVLIILAIILIGYIIWDSGSEDEKNPPVSPIKPNTPPSAPVAKI